jgi:hypothetical protein
MGKKPEEHWSPTRCDMPDLSSLNGKKILGLILNLLFRGGGPKNNLAKALVNNYIRLVDQILWEYNAARDSLELYVSTPNEVISPLFKCIGHMESCIRTINRAINFARKIRHHQESPDVEKLNVLSGRVGNRIEDMRNAIEHLECDILAGKMEEGGANTLIVRNDRIELFDKCISYSELAKWIEELHDLASKLKDYREKENNA